MHFEVKVFLFSLISFAKALPDITIFRISVEDGISVVTQPNPRFAWHLSVTGSNASQSAYQILVASNEDLLTSTKPDLWDSGKVYSDVHWNVRYRGKRLPPGQKLFWAVRAWDQNDIATNYAEGSWKQDKYISQWKARWISAPKKLREQAFKDIEHEDQAAIEAHPGLKPVLYFRKTFTNEEHVKSAYVYCTAKGVFQG